MSNPAPSRLQPPRWKIINIEPQRNIRGVVRGGKRHASLRRGLDGVVLVGGRVALEAELLQLAIKRRAMVVEYLGGLLDVAPGAFERLRDGLALYLLHRHVGRYDAAGVRAPGRAKMFRHVLRDELVLAREEDGVLYDRLKLAHVAGPVVAREQREARGRDAAYAAAVLLRVGLQETLGQRRDVVGARAQRGHRAAGRDR